jgi:hypothetical protein
MMTLPLSFPFAEDALQNDEGSRREAFVHAANERPPIQGANENDLVSPQL